MIINYQHSVKANQFIMCMINSIRSYDQSSVDHVFCYRKCIDGSHAKLLIIHENSCHCSFYTPSWTCSWPSYANAITLWLSIWSCVVNSSREDTLWVDGRYTHDPMPHTQVARKRRRVLCLRTDFSLISFAWNVFFYIWTIDILQYLWSIDHCS